MQTTCRNCGKTIHILAFKGTGYCSVDCKKALGIDHVEYGQSTMMLVTREEESHINLRRGNALQERETTQMDVG